MPRSGRIGPGRVLLITTHYHPVVGGVETHARDVASGLRTNGRKVVVLTTRVEGVMPRPVARVDRVPVIRTWPAVGRQRWTKWWFVPVAIVAAIRLRRHVDVLFCPDLRGVGIAAIVAGWWMNVPVVLQGATPGAYSASHWDASAKKFAVRPPQWLIDAARRRLLALHRRAAAAVCISREDQREAIASGIPPERTHYIPHGVDVDRFHPIRPAERDALRGSLGWDSRLTVLFLGRLSREKGVMDLLEAWARQKRSHARLVLVGPDMTGHPLDAGPAARAFVAAHGLANEVVFAGSVAEPVPLLQASDVLVQPSHYEAFGITVIEAMASGLPIVATAVGGMRDYLSDGENALLCPPNDVDALAHRLDRILDDAELRKRLSSASRTTVLARFDRQANLDAYGRLFDALATAPPGPRRSRS